jgi:ribonuclease HII
MILGIDEAGRGPWAGPLVVGAVVLGGVGIEGLTDSKKLTKKKRELLYDEITAKAPAYASGWVTASELDEVGMSEALRLATRRAVEQIVAPYSEIIIDGAVNFLSHTGKGKYARTMPKADLLIPSVSAASIIAKVERDRYMAEIDQKYPDYGFKSHAGYGVAKHREAIERLGVTPEHRLSFAPLSRYRSTPPSSLETTSGITEVPRVQSTRAVGDLGEDATVAHLQETGHTILDRNWRTKFCEIDIVSYKDDTIYFVEVKYRRDDRAGGGLAYITPKKLKQMEFAARMYQQGHRNDSSNLRLVAVATAGSPPKVVDYVII